MTRAIHLNDIYIGSIDGENEASLNNFEQLFYTKNSKYSELRDNNKFIISGRKGTGKTILANYLVKKLRDKNHLCKVYSKSDFNLQKLIDLDQPSIREEERTLFWKWFFLIQISKLLLTKHKIKKYLPYSSVRKINKFIKMKYSDDIFRLVDYTTSESSKLSQYFKLPSKKMEYGLSSDESKTVNSSYKKQQYYDLLSVLENSVFKCLKSDVELTIILDDLDEMEERLDKSEGYYRFFTSMLETIKSLNMNFRKLDKKETKIIALLRTDIISQIHKYSSNSNKLITEAEVNLNWITKNVNNPADHPLMDMILHKVKQSNVKYSTLEKYSIYTSLFAKQIQHKPIINYLLDYSFGRPRDIVHYLNLIMKKFPNATHFEPHFFKECAKDYSHWFYNELLNEINIHTNKSSILDGLRLINDIKKNNMSFDTINTFLTSNQSSYNNITNIKETLNDLYILGVIGNSWEHDKTKKGKSIYHYSWGYRDTGIDINYSQHFIVHYGLRKHFSLQ